MTDAVRRIRRTWAKATVDPVALTQFFYTRLFQLAPQTQSLFRSDMEAQGTKLAQTLEFVVDNLDEPDILLPAARDLAVRHVAYGVTAEQYAFVGQSLIESLKHLLGSDFEQADHDAWAETYTGLATYMIENAGYTKG